MDIVFLHGLKVQCVVGIWEWERRTTQTVIIDLDMGTDIRRAAASEKIEDALDYKRVAKRVSAFVAESGFQLVETMAERVAGLLLEEFGLPWCRVRINKKGAIRGAGDVGVLIEREAKAAG
jgi:dihydroneopterin aldolase